MLFYNSVIVRIVRFLRNINASGTRFQQQLVWSRSYASSQLSRLDGSPMGRPRCPNPRATASQGRPRPSMEGSPQRSQRHPLVLRTGAPWADLPERYPSYQTCHRRFQEWVRSGIMRGVLEALAEDLRIQGRLDVREAFIDGSFAPAKKGDRRSAKRNVTRERRSWPWQTAMASW